MSIQDKLQYSYIDGIDSIAVVDGVVRFGFVNVTASKPSQTCPVSGKGRAKFSEAFNQLQKPQFLAVRLNAWVSLKYQCLLTHIDHPKVSRTSPIQIGHYLAA
jgi:hypothetical protein